MGHKERKHSPKCAGRFGELRGSFYEAARDVREMYDNPLLAIGKRADLDEVVEYNLGEDRMMAAIYDANDPYFDNRRDVLRGDPLVGEESNWVTALTPFVYEGMRETLLENVLAARQRMESGDNGKSTRRIAERDFTIVENSVYPGLLDDYARLYLSDMDVDSLRPIHRGIEWLDRDLKMDMSSVMVPKHRTNGKKEYVPLSGYFMRAEFGTGQNTSRTLVSSAPYRVELFKREDETNSIDEFGYPRGKPVFGMSFFLKHPDTAVIYQIQDIRGDRVPEGTTDGLCALTLMEKIGCYFGFKRLQTYSYHTNPVRYLYPSDSQIANVLKINFDEAAHRLEWTPMVQDKNGQNEGYEKELICPQH